MSWLDDLLSSDHKLTLEMRAAATEGYRSFSLHVGSGGEGGDPQSVEGPFVTPVFFSVANLKYSPAHVTDGPFRIALPASYSGTFTNASVANGVDGDRTDIKHPWFSSVTIQKFFTEAYDVQIPPDRLLEGTIDVGTQNVIKVDSVHYLYQLTLFHI